MHFNSIIPKIFIACMFTRIISISSNPTALCSVHFSTVFRRFFDGSENVRIALVAGCGCVAVGLWGCGD